MQHFFVRLIPILAIVWLVTFSCTKVSSFGEELLQDQIADYEAATFPVICSMELEDTVLTSDRTSSGGYLLCGQLNDPQFGMSKSEIFTQITQSSQTPQMYKPNTKYDSMVLILPYASEGVYGDTNQLLNLKVYSLMDTVARRDYYSHQQINTNTEVGSLQNFTPRPTTAKLVITDTVTKVAYLRVPMDAAFGQTLFGIDSTTMNDFTAFWRLTKGLKIECTSSSTPGTMLAFNLNSTNCIMRMYYKKDTVALTYDYQFRLSGSNANGMTKFAHFSHDYTGSAAFASTTQTNPNLLYVQGMQGVRIKVEFPDEQSLRNVLINKAELQLTVAPVSTEVASLTPALQTIMTEKDTNINRLVVIEDVEYALNSSSLGFLFGGRPFETIPSGSSTSVKRYELNLTKRYQDILINGPSDPKNRILYVNVFPQSTTAARTIFYGASSTNFPAVLRVKYTKL